MRSLAVRLGVAAIACLIGVVANTVWSTVRPPYLTDAGKLQTIKSAPLDLHLLSFSVVTSIPVQQHNLG